MNNERKNLPSIPIGITSLITIFIVICISIFSVLSFVHANNDYNLSVKTGDYIKSYNNADIITEKIVSEIKLSNTTENLNVKNIIKENNCAIENTENGTFTLTVPINDTMDLKTVLLYNDTKGFIEKERTTYSKASENEGSGYLELFDINAELE